MHNSVMQRSSFAPRAHDVLGEKCRQTRLFTSVVLKRFGFQETAWKSWQGVENRPCELCEDGIIAMRTSVSLIIEIAVCRPTHHGRIAPRIAKLWSVTASLKKVLTAEVGEDSTEADQIKNLRHLQ